MSGTLDPVAMELDQRQLSEQMPAQAKEQGVELVGPNGLLNQLTRNVLETALDAEVTEHLGCGKHDPSGRGSGNSRNGTRAKTVLTEIGPVEIDVPRGVNSSFEPQIVKKRQRRLTGLAVTRGQHVTLRDHLPGAVQSVYDGSGRGNRSRASTPDPER